MKVLPERTTPPASPIRRRHTPQRTAFDRYRACLRWEFGFTCAFCLLHEADLEPDGVEGSGLTWIEHRETQESAPELADAYANCLYSCRWCNGTRGTRPIADSDGSRLLDPCADAWGAHFSATDDWRLTPRDNDLDAQYTERTYRLNAPNKCSRRKKRQEAIADAERALDEIPSCIVELLSAAQVQPERRSTFVTAAAHLRERLNEARQQLRRFALEPVDAPRECRCQAPLAPPEYLVAQCSEIPLEP